MKSIKSKFAAALLAGSLAISFVGSVAAEPLKIRIGWANMPAHMVPVLFSKPEILKHHGQSYVVEATKFSGSSAQIAALAADQIDISTMSPSAMALAIANAGVNLKMFADVTQDAMDRKTIFYLAKKGSGINSPADLRGKRIATNVQGSALDLGIRLMLDSVGLDPSRDVNIVEVPFASAPEMLKEGKVDFAALVQPFVQPLLDSGEYQEVANLLDIQGGPFQIVFLAAKSSFLDSNKEVVTDFVEDYVRARQWFMAEENRKEAIQIIANYMQVPEAQLERQFGKDDFYRDFWSRPLVDGAQRGVDAAFRVGFLKQNLTVSPDHVDLSFVDEAKRRIGD